jgi:hypothetical protein
LPSPHISALQEAGAQLEVSASDDT